MRTRRGGRQIERREHDLLALGGGALLQGQGIAERVTHNPELAAKICTLLFRRIFGRTIPGLFASCGF